MIFIKAIEKLYNTKCRITIGYRTEVVAIRANPNDKLVPFSEKYETLAEESLEIIRNLA